MSPTHVPLSGQDVPGRETTRRAIDALFFPKPGEPRSVVLKRGPVLLNGEERELTLLTHGFLFSRVELDAIVSLLLEGDGEGKGGAEEEEGPTSPERLSERFRDIDADRSGAIDRREINDFFRGMGMPLSGPALDSIMDEYDLNSDDVISWNEFKSMMREIKTHRQSAPKSKTRMSWRSLGTKLRGALGRTGVARKLDAAFEVSDVRRIEHLGVAHSDRTRAFADSAWAPLTLALHVGGEEGREATTPPLLVTCAKPGHVEAWMEAFRACCATTAAASSSSSSSSSPGAGGREEASPGVVWGRTESRDDARVPREKKSICQWSGSNVDWAGSSEHSNLSRLYVSG